MCIVYVGGGNLVNTTDNQSIVIFQNITDVYSEELDYPRIEYVPPAPTHTATIEPTFTPTATNTPVPTATPEPVQQAVYTQVTGDELFIQGYLDFNGNQAWLNHFLYDVAPCEGGYEYLASYPTAPLYLSRLQFNPGSWATAAAATGRYDPANPYDVGANTAWWANAIDHPGTTSGWPHCWWVGNVP